MNEHQIFLSYGSPDTERASDVYERLKAHGLNVWFDRRKLQPGQKWDLEIQRALRQSDIILFLISENSIEKRGYVQREIKLALRYLEEKLPSDIYAIPVLLNSGVKLEPPLSDIQYIATDDPEFEVSLFNAIREQLTRLGKDAVEAELRSDVRMVKYTRREKWEGLPGYEFEYVIPQFQSDIHIGIGEITTTVESELLKVLWRYRRQKFAPEPEVFRWAQPLYSRTNTFSASIFEYHVIGRILSISYIYSFDNARAAHGALNFKTFNFFLNPLCFIEKIEDLFLDGDEIFPAFRDFCRAELKKKLSNDGVVPEGYEAGKSWIDSGTETWGCFENFSFADRFLSIHFSPYMVASYVEGPQRIDIPISEFSNAFANEVCDALDIWR